MTLTSSQKASNGRTRKLEGKRILITGGAGFIGSHLVDRLSQKNEIIVVDNLSAGKIEFIRHHLDKESIEFIKGDVMDDEVLDRAMKGVDVVFHLAANPDARVGPDNTFIHIQTERCERDHLPLHLHGVWRSQRDPHSRDLRTHGPHLFLCCLEVIL